MVKEHTTAIPPPYWKGTDCEKASVKAEGAPAVLQCSINDQTQEVTVENNDWVELRLRATRFSQGTNRLRLWVKRGTVQCDWVDFK